MIQVINNTGQEQSFWCKAVKKIKKEDCPKWLLPNRMSGVVTFRPGASKDVPQDVLNEIEKQEVFQNLKGDNFLVNKSEAPKEVEGGQNQNKKNKKKNR